MGGSLHSIIKEIPAAYISRDWLFRGAKKKKKKSKIKFSNQEFISNLCLHKNMEFFNQKNNSIR